MNPDMEKYGDKIYSYGYKCTLYTISYIILLSIHIRETFKQMTLPNIPSPNVLANIAI